MSRVVDVEHNFFYQFLELSAELSKIPSTVSAPRDDGVDASRNSVFFVDTQVPKDVQEPLESSPCAIVDAVVGNSG